MKALKIIGIILFLSIAMNNLAFAQKDKMPTKAEMEEMKKNAKKVIQELRKQDPKLADAMEKKLEEDMKRIESSNRHGSPILQSQDSTPKLDREKIAMIPKIIITSQQRTSYIMKITDYFIKNIGTQLNKKMDSFYSALAIKGYTNVAIFNYGISLYPIGRTTPAFLLMLKCLSINPSNSYMQYNFASMLIIYSGAHISLTILQSLNKEFPNFPDLLNNIGQAWYALGDVEKAKTSINACLGFAVAHSQANTTMCHLNFKEGKKAEAKKNLEQAIKTGYNSTLENIAQKMNYKFDKSILNKLPYKTMYDFSFIDKQQFPSGDDDERITKEWLQLKNHWAEMSRHFYKKQKEIQKILDTSKNEITDYQIKLLNSVGSTFTLKQKAQLDFASEELKKEQIGAFEELIKFEEDYKKRKAQIEKELLHKLDEITRSHNEKHPEPIDGICCPKIKDAYHSARAQIEATWKSLLLTTIRRTKNQFFAEERVFQLTPTPLKVLMLKQLYYQRMNEFTDKLSNTEAPPFLKPGIDCMKPNQPNTNIKNMALENWPGDCKESNLSKRHVFPFIKINEMGCNGDQSIEIDIFGFHSTLDFEGFENVTIGVGLSGSTSGTGIGKGLEELGIKELIGGQLPNVGASEDIYITVDKDKGITDVGVKTEAGAEFVPVNRDLDAKIGIKSSFITGKVEVKGSGMLRDLCYNFF